MTVASVYWIRCQDHTDMTSQGYIGVSKNVARRFVEHSKKQQNRHLRFAVEKYGWDNLIKSEILISTEEYCLDIERKLRPADGIGWNCTIGGGIPPSAVGNKYAQGGTWNRGRKHSLETRKKVSEAAKIQWKRDGMREVLVNARKGRAGPNKGRKFSEAHVENMRKSRLGKPSKKKGIPLTVEQIEHYKASLRKNPWTCPHCGKIGLNQGAGTRWHFDNCKKKESI